MSEPPMASGDAVIEHAAAWCIRLHEADCSEHERGQFQQWLQCDPSHQHEYAKMLEIWQQAGYLPQLRSDTI